MNNRSDHILDELLVLQAQDGDAKSLTILVTRWHKKLVAYCYHQTNDLEVSKDLVQECWQAILKGIGSLKDPAKFRVWAFRIVHNKAISWIRSVQRERAMEEEVLYEANQRKVDDPDYAPLRRAVNRLPADQKTTLTLFYHHDYSLKEISEILNVSIGTVKSRLFNARQKLKENYKPLNV